MDERETDRVTRWLTRAVITVAVIVAAGLLFHAYFRPLWILTRTIGCQSNIKDLGLALLMYAQDYRNALPSSTDGEDTAVAAFCTQYGRTPTARRARSLGEALRPYVKSPDLLYCPSDDLCAPRAAEGNHNHLVSYFYRPAINEAARKGSKLGSFYDSSRYVALFERLPFHADARYGWGRYARFNVVFLDAHIAYVGAADSSRSGVKREELPLVGGAQLKRAVMQPGWPCWFNYDMNAKKTVKSNAWDPRRYRDELE